MRGVSKTRRRGEGTGSSRRRRSRGGEPRPAHRPEPAVEGNAAVDELELELRLAEEAVGEPTLEATLLTMWAALESGHPIECPVCSGSMTAVAGCRDCGSRLG